MNIGILALQGDVREHARALESLGVATQPIRRPDDLDAIDGLILPGGESTTLSMLLESSGLFDPVRSLIAGGLPTLGTCAGLVLLATRVTGGRDDQRSFGLLDCTVRRNGYGRQQESFEGAVVVAGALANGVATMPAVFIRAPVIESVEASVEVLARLADPAEDGAPVACRQGNVVATAFHPELTPDRRVHRLLVSMAG